MTMFTLLAALLPAAHAAQITISPASGVVKNIGGPMWGDPAWSTGSNGIVLASNYGLTVANDGSGGGAVGGAIYFPITFVSGRRITDFTICYQTVDDDTIFFELTESDLETTVLYADPEYSRSSTAGQCDTVVLDVVVTKSLTLTINYSAEQVTINSISLTTSK